MRAAVVILIAVLVILSLGTFGVGWYYSDQILGPDQPSSLEEQRVLRAWADSIELSRDVESVQPGRWALQWGDGYGALGDVLSSTDTSVVRAFRAVVGTPPVGRLASIKGVSRSADPRTMLGLPYEDVFYSGELGNYPAWLIPGRDSTWLVFVHGRGANPSEALRTLDVIGHRGLPGLAITYRNDRGAPPSKDGRFHLGQDEWRDLESAVRWVVGQGARDVVLIGYSMGGQIVMQFMEHSDLAARARGVVLESPVLDWSATLDLRAKEMGIPSIVTRAGQAVATLRAGLDWDGLDRVRHARGLKTPMLLFHNQPDVWTPIAVSESLAAALPGVVAFVRVPTGGHVEAWNADRQRYAAALDSWLTGLGLPGEDSTLANPR